MALTPQEEIELIELEQESRRRRAASDNKPAKAESLRPARLGAEGGLLAGMVPGEALPGNGAATRMLDSALEVGLPALAQTAASPLSPVAMAGAGGISAGVGNALAQGRRMLFGEQDKFSPGEVYQSTALGAIPVGGPGAIAAERGIGPAVKGAIKTGGQMAVNSAVGEQIKSLVDGEKMPGIIDLLRSGGIPAALGAILGAHGSTGSIENIKDSVRNKNIRNFIKEGGKVPPSMVEPSLVNQAADWAGNKANIAREAAVANEATGTRLAKADAGIPQSSDITKSSIDESLKKIGEKYYKPIADAGPDAAAALEKYKQTKDEIVGAKKALDTSFDNNRASRKQLSDELKDAQEAHDKAISDLKDIIGDRGMEWLYDGEKQYAKAVDVLESSNLDSGSIDPSKLNKRDNLSGNLATVAAFNGAVGNGVSKEATKIQSPIVGRLFSGIGGGIGFKAGGYPGLVAGVAAPVIAENLIRKAQLSKAVQSRLAQPRVTYNPSVNDGIAAFFAQLAANNAKQP